MVCVWANVTNFPITTRIEGPESVYTSAILKWIAQWPPKGFGSLLDQSLLKSSSSEGNPVKLQCIETVGNQFYIGLRQEMFINAPLSRVESILDDFDHYQYLFPGYKDIHVISQKANQWITYWEQNIPLFFIPNVKYQMTYLIDKTTSSRRIYRYQLKESQNLKVSDGFIVLEELNDLESSSPKVHYTEFDFFDADWGVLKTIAPSKIWKESVEGIYLSDLAIRLKAEHPDWDYETISKEARKLLDLHPVQPVIDKKVTFSEDFASLHESKKN